MSSLVYWAHLDGGPAFWEWVVRGSQGSRSASSSDVVLLCPLFDGMGTIADWSRWDRGTVNITRCFINSITQNRGSVLPRIEGQLIGNHHLITWILPSVSDESQSLILVYLFSWSLYCGSFALLYT